MKIFLKGLRKLKICKESVMFSLDIDNMFLSIPLEPVISKACEILLSIPGNKFSKKSLELLFEMCTSGVTFKFNNKFYKQHKGLAMGSPLASILIGVASLGPGGARAPPDFLKITITCT